VRSTGSDTAVVRVPPGSVARTRVAWLAFRFVNLSVAGMQLSARRWLRSLHQEVCAAGLAAAAALPGLGAALDQHAAAVRDATTMGMEHTAAVAGLVMLAHYGRGVLAEARRHGWRPPLSTEWAQADWISVRLVSVSALAHATGPVSGLPPWPHPPVADPAL